MKKFIIVFAVLVVVLLGIFGYAYKQFNVPTTDVTDVNTQTDFTLPAGFKVALFSNDVAGARVIEFGPKGTILVSQPSEGKISALPDANGDGVADQVVTVASGLNAPHGLVFHCHDSNDPTICDLYVAETNALSVFDYDAESMQATNKKKLLDLPAGGGGHVTRSLLFLPSPNDHTLLISIGSTCNVCLEKDVNQASIIAYDVNTGKSEQYARGLRNSVFMTLHPVTGEVWATEMGRDNLGDDIPPDEINIIKKGKNYGWPICYGKNIHDGEFDKNVYIRNPCMDPFETGSQVDLQAHSAPLGIGFIPEEGWDEDMWFDALVAYHGSWNRSVPTGYKIVRVKLDAQGNYVGVEDFITGWLKSDGTKIGRPVDVKVLSGGTIYISDDDRGAVYRVSRI